MARQTLSHPSQALDARPTRGQARSGSALRAHVRIPLYREGYALIMNSALTSLFGVAYWLLAARHYSPDTVGLNSAVISALMFLSGISQLNLMSALMRFIPVSGRKTTRLVISSYLLSVGVATVAAVIFLLGVPLWTPALSFLSSSLPLAIWFVAGTMAWCVFALQDSILTGLRAAWFVPVENLVYSVLKIALLVALVGVSPHYGIFASWTAGLTVSLVGVNLLIFRRLLPRHLRKDHRALRPPTRRQLRRFVSAESVGELFWLGATMLMPVIVVALASPTETAYFALAWMIVTPLYALSANTGASLVVTGSGDQNQLPHYARKVLIQTAAMAIPLALCFVATAPILLRAFGGEYAAHSTTTLRLLALSAIPHMVNALYMSVYRVRLKMSAVVAILGALCSLVLVLGTVLLQVIGIAGIGIAWLVSELVVVAVLVAVDPRALWPLRGR